MQRILKAIKRPSSNRFKPGPTPQDLLATKNASNSTRKKRAPSPRRYVYKEIRDLIT